MARKKRALTPDEQSLWDKVIKQVETIETMPPLVIAPAVKLAKKQQEPAPAVRPFKIGVKAQSKPPKQTEPSFADRPNQTTKTE